MSFNTALSGLRAANTDLSVTGNNIANASTTGFKRSRTEFGDVYANQLVGGGVTAGSGVLVTAISQQFGQGNISFTDNALDLAVNGQGFFVLSDGGARAYTRAGNFGLDNQGFIVGNGGAKLQGFPADAQGVITQGVLDDLQIQTTSLAPNLTQSADLEFNLNSGEPVPAITPFDAQDPDTFNASTSLTIFDSLGNPHVQSQFFVKTGPNSWDMNIQVDGANVGANGASVTASTTTSTAAGGFVNAAFAPATIVVGAGPFIDPATGATHTNVTAVTTLANGNLQIASDVAMPGLHSTPLTFSSDGALTTTAPIAVDNWWPGTGAIMPTGSGINQPADSSSFLVNISTATQFGGEFSVSSINQDGFSAGRLAGVEVSDTGVIFARYTNGESLNLGQLALANFDNSQGLTPLGDTAWAESFESGQPVVGEPQSGSMGAVQSGALEESNVDLSEELVRLIIAQRNFQANTKTIETANTVTQSIINLR